MKRPQIPVFIPWFFALWGTSISRASIDRIAVVRNPAPIRVRSGPPMRLKALITEAIASNKIICLPIALFLIPTMMSATMMMNILMARMPSGCM